MRDNLNISFEQFEKLFPFLVGFNNDLTIVCLGKSAKKLYGNIEGEKLFDAFDLVRPGISVTRTFDGLKLANNLAFVLQSRNKELPIRSRGQMIQIDDKEILYYINSPWLNDDNDFGKYNLQINDFAIHDCITDNVQLLKTHQNVNNDLITFNEQLYKQNDELQIKNKIISELAEFPEQNPHPVMRITFDGTLMYKNKVATNLLSQFDFLSHEIIINASKSFVENNYNNIETEAKVGDKFYLISLVPFPEKEYFNVYLIDVTIKLEYENELLLTNSRLGTLINGMNSGVIAEDENRKVIFANREFCRIFQILLNPEELRNTDCAQAARDFKKVFIDPERFIEGVEERITNKKPVYGEIFFSVDGRTLERDYVPIIEGGKYKGNIWKYQDITHILEEKRSLQLAEEKYKKIIENMELGLIEVNLNDVIVKAFPAFCKLLGYNEQELIGKNAIAHLIAPENLEQMNAMNDARLHGIAEVYETRMRRKDGGVLDVLVSASPVYDNQNKIVGSIGICLDITMRKSIERLVSSQKHFYESILNNIPADIAVFNLEHEYLYVNPTAIKSDTIRSWIIGKTDIDYFKFKGKSLEKAEERHSKFLKSIQTMNTEDWVDHFIDATGKDKYVLRRFYPFTESDNMLSLVIGYGIDITDRKMLEIALLAANKSREAFVANMGHEFRTPMNVIIGLSDLLLDLEISSEQRRFVNLIRTSASNLLTLLNDLLDFSKIHAGKLSLESIDFSLFDLIDHLRDTFQLSSLETNITFDVSYDQHLNERYIGDPFRLNQVLMNLLSNAFKFTEAGLIQLEVKLNATNENEHKLRFAVKDSGLGIESSKLELIFEDFAQEDVSTSRKYGGTGLGLSICKGLVNLMGGELKVNSDLGVGSEFYFEIDLKKAISVSTNRIENNDDEIIAKLKSKRILVVEDNRLNQIVITELLKRLGLTYNIVSSGSECLAELDRLHYDIVLMDIQMPGMNGIEVTGIIRDKLQLTIPIIALTANTMQEQVDQYLNIGMNDFIAKPIQKYELISRIYAQTFKFDLTYLGDISNNDDQFISNYLTECILGNTSNLIELKEHLDNHRLDQFVELFHKMKPSLLAISNSKYKDRINNFYELLSTNPNKDLFSTVWKSLNLETSELIKQLSNYASK